MRGYIVPNVIGAHGDLFANKVKRPPQPAVALGFVEGTAQDKEKCVTFRVG